MTINDLKQCRRYRFSIEDLEERIKRLRATAERMTHTLSCTPGGGQARDVMPDYVVKLDELQRELANKLIEKERRIEEIEGELELLPEQQAQVLRLRYVEGLSWKKVAKGANYCEQHCKKINKRVLEKMRLNAPF